jgi:predicted transposase/invertase (TIGR01784 family)
MDVDRFPERTSGPLRAAGGRERKAIELEHRRHQPLRLRRWRRRAIPSNQSSRRPIGRHVSDPKHPHDSLFKATFSHVGRAAAELRAVLPAALARRIDFGSLAIVPGTHVDKRLRNTHSDLLFRARIDGKSAFLYLLFEHQSQPDELMAFRMLRYVVHILERHIDQAQRRSSVLPLPIVIPIVLHHGAAGWTASTTMVELFDPALARDPNVSPYLPQFSFLLDDLRNATDEELAARNLGDFASLALWSMRDSRETERLLSSLDFWAATLDRLASGDAAAFELILRYLLAVVPDLDLNDVLQLLQTRAPVAEQLMTTMGERLEAKGEARGRAEGLRRMLLHQLTLKFGKLDDDTRARIDRALENELLAYSERVLTADSLAAVLRD